MNAGTRSAIAQWAADSEARTLRHAVAVELAAALGSYGQQIRLIGHVIGDGRVTGASPWGNGNDGLVAMGYLAETAGELLTGIEGAVSLGQVYVASTLGRQLVEFEYLTWAFATEHDDAAVWLNSSDEERRQMWQPKHLRQRSGGLFQGRDYSSHCELGGHPTPRGLHALMNAHGDAVGEVVLTDSLNHTVRVWESVMNFAREPSSVDVESLDRRINQWRLHDKLREVLTDGLTAGGLA